MKSRKQDIITLNGSLILYYYDTLILSIYKLKILKPKLNILIFINNFLK